MAMRNLKGVNTVKNLTNSTLADPALQAIFEEVLR
jgi:hypothetical protein